jgi:CPA1 family monovalent cation:H+ antiporter
VEKSTYYWLGRMRGVVSLATALSIPVLMNDGTAFPFRSLIIFITFVVIFITLVFQGLTLPLIIKTNENWESWMQSFPSHEQQAGIQIRLDTAAINMLDNKYEEEMQHNNLVRDFKEHLENDSKMHEKHLSSLEVCSNRQKGFKGIS